MSFFPRSVLVSAVTGWPRLGPSANPSSIEVDHATEELHRDSLLEVAALPTAVRVGRRHVRQVLREWELDAFAADAELLVSELLTNAVRAPCSIRPGLLVLRLFATRRRLLIEVYDNSSGDPAPREANDEAESGRGYVVIEALADTWGYHRFHPRLKVVWVELHIPEHS